MADESTPEQVLKTYHGNCHCASFKYTITLPEITTAVECNCSICTRKGYKWLFPPPGSFTINTPDFELTTYIFNSGTTLHKFCRICGTAVMGFRPNQPSGRDVAINLRTLQDFDPLSLPVHPYNGRGIEPPWVPHVLNTALKADENVYYGSCHCGNVKFRLKQAVPFETGTEKMTDCNCSICVRNANVLFFPSPQDLQTEISTPTTRYAFADKRYAHEFCPVCGCHVRIPEIKSAQGADVVNPTPHNLRMFEGVDFAKLQDKLTHYNSKVKEPQYVVS